MAVWTGLEAWRDAAKRAKEEFCKRQMGLSYPRGHWDADRVYFVLEEVLPCCTDEIRSDTHKHMEHACGKAHLAVKFGTTVEAIEFEIFNP